MEVKVTRMYSGDDGESHFEDITLPMKDQLGFFEWTDPIKTTGIIFGELYYEGQDDWHNAPRRQYFITLSGEVEMTVSDGESRVFRAGDILLAEDTTGRGHRRRKGKDGNHRVAIITLD